MIGLHELAQRLGGDLGRNGIVTCPGPGHSPKDRSLSVWLDGDDLRVYSFAGDDWQVCKDHVRERLGLPSWEPGKRQNGGPPTCRARASYDRGDLSRIALARRIWREGEDPRVAPVLAYLDHRGLPPLAAEQLPVFRYHGRCPFDGERVPALICRFSPIENDPGLETEPTAILRVRLDRYDGARRKLCLGPSRGQVIKLCRDLSLAGIGVCEGTEKALAIIACGWRPVWVTSGTSTLRTFPLVPHLECLTIFSDADDPGRNAALACAARWHDAGREVRILQPPAPHGDWDQWFVGGAQ